MNQVQIDTPSPSKLETHTSSYIKDTDPLEKVEELLHSWKETTIECGLNSIQLNDLSCLVVDHQNKKHILKIPPSSFCLTSIRCSILEIKAISLAAHNPKESYASLWIRGKKIKNNIDFEFSIDIYGNDLGPLTCTELLNLR